MSKIEKLKKLFLDDANHRNISRKDLFNFLIKVVGCSEPRAGNHYIFTYTNRYNQRKNVVVPNNDPILRYTVIAAVDAYYDVFDD